MEGDWKVVRGKKLNKKHYHITPWRHIEPIVLANIDTLVHAEISNIPTMDPISRGAPNLDDGFRVISRT